MAARRNIHRVLLELCQTPLPPLRFCLSSNVYSYCHIQITNTARGRHVNTLHEELQRQLRQPQVKTSVFCKQDIMRDWHLDSQPSLSCWDVIVSKTGNLRGKEKKKSLRGVREMLSASQGVSAARQQFNCVPPRRSTFKGTPKCTKALRGEQHKWLDLKAASPPSLSLSLYLHRLLYI